jgi:hypothetical protein
MILIPYTWALRYSILSTVFTKVAIIDSNSKFSESYLKLEDPGRLVSFPGYAFLLLHLCT